MTDRKVYWLKKKISKRSWEKERTYFLAIFLLSWLVKTNVNEYCQSLGSSSKALYKIKITSHFVRTLATIQVRCYGDK